MWRVLLSLGGFAALPAYAQDMITLSCDRVTGEIPAYNEFSLDLDHEYVIDNVFDQIRTLTAVKEEAITVLVLKPFRSERHVVSREDWKTTIAVCDKTVEDLEEPTLSPQHLDTWCSGEWKVFAEQRCRVE